MESVRHPALFRIVMALSLGMLVVAPMIWPFCVLVILIYPVVFFTGRYRLPFCLPLHHRGFRGRGDGLLYLGNAESTGEQLWISNSDSRRHALVLGTTGSGKALPNDTPVLTRSGWVPIAGLSEGDHLIQPSGRLTRVRGVYPQTRLAQARITLADGRSVLCSRDHLWPVCQRNQDAATPTVHRSVMTTADIGFLIAMNSLNDPFGATAIGPCLPLVAPLPGLAGHQQPDVQDAMRIGTEGFSEGDLHVPLCGPAAHRLQWFGRMLTARHRRHAISMTGSQMDVRAHDVTDANGLQQMAWSLGGTALHVVMETAHVIRMTFPGQNRIGLPVGPCDPDLLAYGIGIVSVEGGEHDPGEADAAIGKPVPMTCIEVEAADGLFVIENCLATHNTEMLFGMVSQSLIWSSGFLFIDGKGTGEFHARVWSLVKRFGRQDDYRILNFTGVESHDAPTTAFSPIQSNTINPFSHGTSDQLMNLIVSLMGEVGSGSDMWHQRAMALVTSAVQALCEMRDAGDVLLNAQTIREFLPLGVGVGKDLLGDRVISDVRQIPGEAWDEMRHRGGMIELYLRSLNGEFSPGSQAPPRGLFVPPPALLLPGRPP
ncbi:MAG: hypothetical protein OXC91_08560, partial [Rhodobacteraceae bacterium]|nr:hypothetical protein [Paracoccaceae bacterium]